MATLLQKNLAQEIVTDAKRRKQGKKSKNGKELLVSAGYDLTTAEASPGRTIKQKGVKEELKKLGFSEEGAKKVVVEIMYDSNVQPTARLQATRQVFEVHGTFAPEKHLIFEKKIIKLDL